MLSPVISSQSGISLVFAAQPEKTKPVRFQGDFDEADDTFEITDLLEEETPENQPKRDRTLPREGEDKAVKQLLPLAYRIAYHMKGQLPPSVELGDIINAGLEGLLDGIRRFEGELTEKNLNRGHFYLRQRILGSIRDELKRTDTLPSKSRKEERQIYRTTKKLEQKYKRIPTFQEVKMELMETYEYSESEAEKMLVFQDYGSFISLETIYPEDEDGDWKSKTSVQNAVSESPLSFLLRQERTEVLSAKMYRLSKQEKTVLLTI